MTSLRPSFAERDAFRELLSTSYADGRLDDEQFRMRQGLVDEAATIEDLLVLAEGLPLDGVVLPQTAEPIAADDAERRWRPRAGVLIAAAAAAAALGFLTAGGLGGSDRDITSASASEDAPMAAPQPLAAGGLTEMLAWLENNHYDQIETIVCYPDRLDVVALVPGRDRALDAISWTQTGDPEVSPDSTLSDSDDLFALHDVDYSVLPAAVAAAPDVVGSATEVSSASIRVESGEPRLSVYVSGDEYGEGSGYATWSPDGQQLLQVSRG